MLKKTITATLAVCLLSFAGCVSDAYNPNPDPDPTPGPNPNGGPVFDFSTEKSYTLTIRYDVPEGYQVGFSVYTEEPTTLNEEGQVVRKDIKAIDKGFTDKSGVYNKSIKVPTTAKKLFIYSTYPGVPELLTAEVTGDVLSEAAEPDYTTGAGKTKSYVLRADEGYKNELYNKMDFSAFNMQRLGFWQNFAGHKFKNKEYYAMGRPDYLLPNKLPISSDVYKIIAQELEEGKAVDYSKLGSGDINVIKDAHVDLYLLSETTSASSTLAYFCYPTNNPPKSVAAIKSQTIAFPNAKELKNHGYEPQGWNGAMAPGEGIRLHYFVDGVDKGTVFPEGTSIGWVLYNNGYRPASKNLSTVNKGLGEVYSNPALANGNKFVALFRLENFIIYGFEDWDVNGDCNDLVFHVESDPIESITPGVPEIKPDEPSDDKVVESFDKSGTLTFEDLWPNQGDFDMNDVIVKYTSSVGLNMNNEVVKTIDTYTLLWSGASIHNNFAYQLNANKDDIEVEFSSSTGDAGQAYVDPKLSQATIRLFNDALLLTANNTKTSTITVTTTYKRKYDKADIMPPYNPFISSMSDNSKEVHLTGYKPTLSANMALFGTGNDLSNPSKGNYYITFVGEQQMPFAIHLSGDIDFVIPKEGKRIDEYYPKFINWINTNGKQDSDWYKHPKSPKNP